jgi:hypothetical protein
MTPDELTKIATAFGATKAVGQLFGPTLDYFGKGLQEFAEKRVQNVRRAVKWALHFLGDNPPPGQVPPLVFKELIDQASYRDDEVFAC